MANRLEGRVALITGGTSGIGEATVELFVREGAKVVVAGRSEDAGRAIVERLGPSTRFQRCDVTREDEIRDAIDVACQSFGRLDILFNNAGAGTRGGPETVTAEQFHYAMDLLVGSVLFGIKYASPIMKEQRSGRIINNASVAASRTNLGDYLYSAAKAAVVQLTKVAGLQLGPFGITANTISPGAIATPIFYGGSSAARELEPAHNEGKMRKLKGNLAKATPVHRFGEPRDIAYAALYLASDEGAFVNCHDLIVDGGMVAGPPPVYE